MYAIRSYYALTDLDPILTIAQDLFTTMVDGEPGHLYPWMGEEPTLDDARYTWVDVSGPVVTRVMLMAGRETGEHLTRALLAMGDRITSYNVCYTKLLRPRPRTPRLTACRPPPATPAG